MADFLVKVIHEARVDPRVAGAIAENFIEWFDRVYNISGILEDSISCGIPSFEDLVKSWLEHHDDPVDEHNVPTIYTQTSFEG